MRPAIRRHGHSGTTGSRDKPRLSGRGNVRGDPRTTGTGRRGFPVRAFRLPAWSRRKRKNDMPLGLLKKLGAALTGRKNAEQAAGQAAAAADGGERRRAGKSGRAPAHGENRRAARPAPSPGREQEQTPLSPAETARGGRRRRTQSRPAAADDRAGGSPAAPAPATLPPPAAPWSPDSFQVPAAEGRKRFQDFDLPAEILHAIADLGFRYCTPIQAASLAPALAGANVAGRAQTGTGKTAAFLVAILTRFLRLPGSRANKPGTPRALVLAPTRELCVQICRDAEALGRYCGVRSLAVFGGMDYARQQHLLAEAPVDLLVATPGRLLDFQRRRVVDLGRVDTLVIDEADRMLDMGFIPDVRRIVRALPARDRRQTLLYSATLDEAVMRLAAQWMPDPVVVEIDPEQVAAADVRQIVYIVTAAEKMTVLCNLLKRHEGQRVLIFGNRRASTDHLAIRLRRQGFACELLSGDVQQSRRMRVLEDFRSGKVRIVVATDVAGRGLHIADIGLVVNFELPYEAGNYVHRIGRTGRAGQVGTAVSFACEDDSFVIPEIEKLLGEEMKCSQPDEELLRPLPPPATRGDASRRRAAEGGGGEGRRRQSRRAPATGDTQDGRERTRRRRERSGGRSGGGDRSPGAAGDAADNASPGPAPAGLRPPSPPSPPPGETWTPGGGNGS
jgi:ATP-dependent RNA helicase RhlB